MIALCNYHIMILALNIFFVIRVSDCSPLYGGFGGETIGNDAYAQRTGKKGLVRLPQGKYNNYNNNNVIIIMFIKYIYIV